MDNDSSSGKDKDKHKSKDMERKKEKQMRSKTKLLQKLLLVYLPVETRVNVMYKSQLLMLVRRSSEGGLVPLNLVGVEVY